MFGEQTPILFSDLAIKSFLFGSWPVEKKLFERR